MMVFSPSESLFSSTNNLYTLLGFSYLMIHFKMDNYKHFSSLLSLQNKILVIFLIGAAEQIIVSYFILHLSPKYYFFKIFFIAMRIFLLTAIVLSALLNFIFIFWYDYFKSFVTYLLLTWIVFKCNSLLLLKEKKLVFVN